MRRPAVLLALGLCGVGGVVTLLGHLASGPVVELKRVDLTGEAGAQAYPAFSPDGKTIAYSARGVDEDEGFHIFVRPAAAGGTARQLTTGDSSDIGPVWSPDGRALAFARVDDDTATAMTIAPEGGAPRKVADFAWQEKAGKVGNLDSPLLAWTPDGKSFVVSVAQADVPAALWLMDAGGGRMLRQLTHPPQGCEGDSDPVVAPDGTVAFLRTVDDDHSDVYLIDLKGTQPRQLTFDGRSVRGMAWTPGGRDLVYASARGVGWRLWRVPAYGGAARDLQVTGMRLFFPAIAPTGSRLAYMESPAVTEVWQAKLGDPQDGAAARPLIRSSGREMDPSFSPDGKAIANVSDQNGSEEIWILTADGRQQVTRMEDARMGQPQWSRDGRTLLFECHSPRGTQLYETPASAAGKPVAVMANAVQPSWSRDGRSIYYVAENTMIWKADADGKNPQQLTHRFGSGGPGEGPDGWVYYRARRAIWRVAAAGGKEEEVFVPERDMFNSPLQVTAKGIYYAEYDRRRRGAILAFYDFASGKSRDVAQLRGFTPGSGDAFSVSPDGTSVAYGRVDNSETHLVMMENFR